MPRLFGRETPAQRRQLAEFLRAETVGGVFLIFAAVLALVLANVTGAYASFRDTAIGPSSLQLHMTLGEWASDGLLVIFFFVAGVELKREFVAGDLRDPRRAVLPIIAAAGGMIAPALIYVGINIADSTALQGWAIPTATDIAFALAVLAVVSSHLPAALRTFLLTLAVVDDLLAICIIAIFYTRSLELTWLLLAIVPLVAFAVLVQRRVRSVWLLMPLALLTWGLVHASGVHATVAGVLLGFMVPVLRRDGADGPGLAELFEHKFRPISAGIAVPVFAFFAAGVNFGGVSGLADSMARPITLGIAIGLLAGKMIGVFGSTWLVATFTGADLDPGLSWWDVLGLSILAGMGFTVSLLIGELAFGAGPGLDDLVKTGVLVGSLVSALVGAAILSVRNRVYRNKV